MHKNLKEALEYINHGWSIIPIKPGEKVPLLTSWLEFQKRHATEVEVTEWYTKWPDANLAIIVGQISGLLVIDIDDLVVGEKSFRKYFGNITTLSVKTPNGIHYYFKHPGDKQISNAIRAAPGLDIKGDGGYVLAPPSVGYKWIRNTLADLPNQTLLTEIKSKSKVDLTSTEIVHEGGRNNDIARFAGKLFSLGLSIEEVFTQSLARTKAFHTPPLPEYEVKTTVNSIAAKEQAKKDAIPVKPGSLILTKFQNIKEEKIEWIWPGVIPKGKLSLIIGDPGHGKSLLSVHVAACVSAGLEFPDGTRPETGNVLMVFCEDEAGDIVRPRLRVAGANLDNITHLEISERFMKLDTDIPKIEDAIKQTEAKLLVIDPISAYLGAVNSWKDDEVRRLLAMVGGLSTRTNCAILCIMHLNKKVSSNAIDRGMGSIAFSAVARSVFLVGNHPEENDPRKILAPVKTNLVEKAKSMIFRINSSQDNYPYIEWEGESSYGTKDILMTGVAGTEEDNKLEQAIIFLENQLRSGDKAARLLYEIGVKEGLTEVTIDRAKKRLGIKSVRDRDRWFWNLPYKPRKMEDDPFSSE